MVTGKSVQSNGVLIGTFNVNAFGRIYVFANGGDDRVAITTKTTKTSIVFGGEGADQLRGGYGTDILLGEGGADILEGRRGRDLLIGGAGADGLSGVDDDDLLIAAGTIYDAQSDALLAILTLSGGSGRDWVLYNKLNGPGFVNDILNDKKSDETATAVT